MPFITEELWQRIAPLAGVQGDTIMLARWPEADNTLRDAEATAAIEWLKAIMLAVRNIRGEMNIPPGKALPLLLQHGDAQDRAYLALNETGFKKLAKIESINWLDAKIEAPASAMQIVGELEVRVPMSDLIDKDAEIARLAKEIDKLDKQITQLDGKLSNAGFTSKAPAEVVEKERQRLGELQQTRTTLADQHSKIKAL
jgi:valyl-tRNA synthetase